MAKVIEPLGSTNVTGTIGKLLTFGSNQAGQWVRALYHKVNRRNAAQDEIRQWFKNVIDYYEDMMSAEKFLWDLVLKNLEEYNRQIVAQTARTWRCHLSHWILSTLTYTWNGSPFPPELVQWIAKDTISNYDQLKADLETLTGLKFLEAVDPYFFPYLGEGTGGVKWIGLSNCRGKAIALKEDYYKAACQKMKDELVAHELTHAIMNQHGWHYAPQAWLSEIVADECGKRVADGELTPIYTWHNLTLGQWIAWQKS